MPTPNSGDEPEPAPDPDARAGSPPGPRSDAAGEPHRQRAMAESFGVDAERYDRARPSYPEALIDRIVGGRGRGRAGRGGPAVLDVLDVGCGTGIEARQLIARGCSVLGVEPDPRMAGFARATGVEVEVATFESWDAGGRSFDTVVAGQSWHWIDPHAGAAKAADVLRPGGRLVLFGHVFDPPADVAEAGRAALDMVAPDRPRAGAMPRSSTAIAGGDSTPRPVVDGYQRLYARFADVIEASGSFGPAESWRFDWTRDYTRDEWLDLLPTTGELTRLANADLVVVLNAVGDAIDARGGGFTMNYVTIAIAAASKTGSTATG